MGRVAGQGTNFPYSKALKEAEITWTEKHLFAFISNPAKHIRGNKMSFGGISGDKYIVDLIAYLKDLH